MAIKERTKKSHFLPYNPKRGREVDTDPAPTVSISRKYNNITFSRRAIEETAMKGAFVRLYFEPTKRIIGWQVKTKLEQEELNSKSWKLVKPTEQGQWGVNIKKMLDSFNGSLNQDTYKGLPVQKYREMEQLSGHSGEIFYFVELSDGIKVDQKTPVSETD